MIRTSGTRQSLVLAFALAMTCVSAASAADEPGMVLQSPGFKNVVPQEPMLQPQTLSPAQILARPPLGCYRVIDEQIPEIHMENLGTIPMRKGSRIAYALSTGETGTFALLYDVLPGEWATQTVKSWDFTCTAESLQ